MKTKKKKKNGFEFGFYSIIKKQMIFSSERLENRGKDGK